MKTKKKVVKVGKRKINKTNLKNMEEETLVSSEIPADDGTNSQTPPTTTETAKPLKIAPLTVDLEREDLNRLLKKVNEIVDYINKQ